MLQTFLEECIAVAEAIKSESPGAPALLEGLQQRLADMPVEVFSEDPRFAQTLTDDSCFDQCAVYNDGYLVVTLMVLPQEGTYPLHDHPGMRVLTKTLVGECVLAETDLADPPAFYARPKADKSPVPLADVTERLQSEGETRLLGPDSPNLHSIFAPNSCVLLDVIFNYYGPGRPCTFFRLGQPDAQGRQWGVPL